MKLVAVVLLLGIASTGAMAQIAKCKGSDGKITYSDAACDNKSTEGAMTQGSVSTMDMSGLRAQTVKNETALVNQPKPAAQKQKKPEPCAVKYANVVPTAAEAKAHTACLKTMPRQ